MSNPEKRYATADTESIQTTFEQAVAFLRANGLAPHPVNYFVAYEYVLGADHQLRQEMDIHIERQLGWDDGLMGGLFDRLIEALREDPYSGVSTELMGLLANLLSQVNDANVSMADYKNLLIVNQGRLRDKPARELLHDIVNDLMSATSDVVLTTSTLQTRLDTTQREAESLRRQLEDIKREAEHDALTGAYNRKALERILDNLYEGLANGDPPFCMLVADVDHFKHFNDSYGHVLGDEVLKRVVQVMVQQVKGGDYVARFGGEEFVVILPGTPLEGAVKVAEGIRHAVEQVVLIRRSTRERLSKVTISLGVGVAKASEDKMTMMERVDAALYRAKNEGRNRVICG
jgi:diguanylate cyclase